MRALQAGLRKGKNALKRKKCNELQAEVQGGFLATCPPSAAESAALATGLTLDGKPLAPPEFHNVEWTNGQRFTAEDDPDRTQEAFDPPSFLQTNPRQQLKKMSCEDLPVHGSCAGSFARVVYGVLDESHCAELIERVNEKGYTPALLNIGGGSQQLEPYVRNGHRVIADIPELSKYLLEVLRPYLPDECGGGRLTELNDRFRFLCYTPGQQFSMHRDGQYSRPGGHPRAGDTSFITVQIYLHDVPEENGGATTFELPGKKLLPCQPKAGSALIFTQDLPHEGSLLKQGLKYTVRTEAMYAMHERDEYERFIDDI